jgi:hypothetical protein
VGEFDKGGMPKRSPNLESRKFDDEFVVLDTETNQAHALEGSAALVWQAIEDGSQPNLPEAEVEEVVSRLVELGLVSTEGLSRRTLLKVGAAGGFALAGITSLALPAAAMAVSNSVMHITTSGQLTVPAMSTVYYTLIGGGGGGGKTSNSSGGPGGNGGQGDIISGSIYNLTSSPRTLTVEIGGGGGGGGGPSGPGGGVTVGGLTHSSSGGTTAFNGGAGNSDGGGGGGASVIYDTTATATAIVVAGGGGGGGGTANGTNGATSSGAGTVNTTDTALSQGNAATLADAGGGGAGAGGGAAGSAADAGGAAGASSSPGNASGSWTIAVLSGVNAESPDPDPAPTNGMTGTAGNGGAGVVHNAGGYGGYDGEAWFNGTFYAGTGTAGN